MRWPLTGKPDGDDANDAPWWAMMKRVVWERLLDTKSFDIHNRMGDDDDNDGSGDGGGDAGSDKNKKNMSYKEM